jgi:hypothetical protein
MELNPYLHYLVTQERRADAMRSAERWRLIKSLKKQDSSAGWLERLGLRLKQSVLVHRDGGTAATESGPRQAVSSPTL